MARFEVRCRYYWNEKSLKPTDKEVFFAALDLSTAAERSAYVCAACPHDAAQRARIEELLANHFKEGPFLDEAAIETSSSFADGVELGVAIGSMIGRYKLLEKIGEGGFGEVYVAEQLQPVRRRVALKLIKLGMDTRQVVARFEAERQALAMMEHPNIAKVLDGGATELGRPYFVMELVRGAPINQFCDDQNLSTPERLDLFMQVCNAIQHAHQKGVIHRDIKPSNILVSINDGAPVPRVIDFGIAKAIEGRLNDASVYTQFHQFIGTPAYVSPEQAEISGVDVDTRTDIYSLGVLLYELLTGSTPLDGKKLMAGGVDEMRKTIRELEAVAPSTRLAAARGQKLKTTARLRRIEGEKLIHALKGDLDWIVMKCLEKDRARRYQSASDLAMDIHRHLTNETVLARPPSRSYQLQKAWQRHKVLYSAGAVAVAALVIGATISVWQAFEARKAQREALHAIDAEANQRVRAEHAAETAKNLLYTASMQLAQQMWDQKNLARLRQLLDETRDDPKRGFEWFYWKRQSVLASWHLRGHIKSVTAVAFSPNGNQILTASSDATAKIWSVEKRAELRSLEGHAAGIRCAAWSHDGRFIATGSQDHTAKIWDARSGRELLSLRMESERAEGAALDPMGRFVAVGGNGGTVRVWRIPDGAELLHFQAHPQGVLSLACSPDGSRLATSSKDQTVRVWDLANGKLLTECTGHRDWVDMVAFSPDGSRLLTGSGDQSARVWDAATGRELLTIPAQSSFVNSVAFSSDGALIGTAHNNWAVKIWSAGTGAELFSLREHTGEPVCIAFSPDSSRILTGGDGSTAILADFSSRHQKIELAESHSMGTDAMGFSPDSRRIVASAPNNTAGVWDAETGRLLFSLNGHRDLVVAATYSPDGATIATASADNTIKLWRAGDGGEIITIRGHRGAVSHVAFSPDGRRLVSASYDLTARFWDASSGAELRSFAHSNAVYAAAFSPDGQKIVTGCGDAFGHVWDAVSGRQLTLLMGHTAPLWSVNFSPDGKRIATGGDLTVRLWDSETGQLLQTFFNHAAQVMGVSFSPDGRRIVSSDYGKNSRIWDSFTGQDLLVLPGGGRFAGFSPDGDRVALAEPSGVKVYTAQLPRDFVEIEKAEKASAQILEKSLRAQAEREAAVNAARAKDEGSIRQWLVVAPIPIPNAPAISIERESALRPLAGDFFPEAGQLKWTPLQAPDYVIDLKNFCGGRAPDSVAYMVCYVISEKSETGVRLLIGADDRGKVFLNGRPVYESAFNRSILPDEDVVENLALNAGSNVIVFKVINDGSDWKASLRLSDSSGDPLPGIRVTLQPAER